MTLVQTLAIIFMSVIVFLAATVRLVESLDKQEKSEKDEKKENLNTIAEAFKKCYNPQANEIDILQLMSFHMAEMTEYYQLSKYQAKLPCPLPPLFSASFYSGSPSCRRCSGVKLQVISSLR